MLQKLTCNFIPRLESFPVPLWQPQHILSVTAAMPGFYQKGPQVLVAT